MSGGEHGMGEAASKGTSTTNVHVTDVLGLIGFARVHNNEQVE